jgi:hypothetical protein
MGLGDKEILVVNKPEYVGFCCSPKLKSEFCKAIAEIGEFNTYTDFFVNSMRQYVAKHTEMKNHV